MGSSRSISGRPAEDRRDRPEFDANAALDPIRGRLAVEHRAGNAIRDLADPAECSEHLRRGPANRETLLEPVGRGERRGDFRSRRGNARREGFRRGRAGRQAGSDPRPDRSQGALGIGDDRRNPALAPGGDDAFHSLGDPDIAGAATKIAAETQPDTPFVGLPKATNQIPGRDQHAGRAESALQCVFPVEGGAQLDCDLVVIQPLDGGDVRAAAGAGEGDARANGLAVDKQRAGPANPMLAPKMRSREVERFPQEVGEMQTGLDLHRNCAAVDAERKRHHRRPRRVHAAAWTLAGPCPLAWVTARRSTVTWM